MDYSVHRTYELRPIIMASLMIVSGILTILFRYDLMSIVDARNITRIASGVVLVVFGLLILVPRYRKIMPTIGLICLGIGISRFLVGLAMSLKYEYNIQIFQDFTVVLQIFGCVVIVFSLYMIYRGSNFMMMDAMNAFFMRFTTMGIILAYVFVVIYAVKFVPGVTLETFWNYRRDFFTTPVLYLFYFVLLCSKEVFDMMSWNRARNGIARVADRMNPGQLTASYGDYERFRRRFARPKRWDPADGRSPVERELRIDLKTDGPGLTLLLEKWKGSDSVSYSLVPGNGGAYVSAVRGTVDRIEFGEAEFSIYGPKHMAMRIAIGEHMPEEEDEDETLSEEDDE